VRRHEVGNQDRSAALRLPRRGALRYVRRFGSAASGCRNRTNLAVGLHRRTALPSTTSASERRRSSRFISPQLRASSGAEGGADAVAAAALARRGARWRPCARRPGKRFGADRPLLLPQAKRCCRSRGSCSDRCTRRLGLPPPAGQARGSRLRRDALAGVPKGECHKASTGASRLLLCAVGRRIQQRRPVRLVCSRSSSKARCNAAPTRRSVPWHGFHSAASEPNDGRDPDVPRMPLRGGGPQH